jgi:hypothetical protein
MAHGHWLLPFVLSFCLGESLNSADRNYIVKRLVNELNNNDLTSPLTCVKQALKSKPSVHLGSHAGPSSGLASASRRLRSARSSQSWNLDSANEVGPSQTFSQSLTGVCPHGLAM